METPTITDRDEVGRDSARELRDRIIFSPRALYTWLMSLGAALFAIGFLTNLQAQLLEQVGAMFFAVGFLEFILQLKRLDAIRSTEILIFEKIDSINSTMNSITTVSGIEKVYANAGKALVNYESMLRKTNQHVEILGATVTPLFWNPDFEDATLDAVMRGVEFRVLLLGPECESLRPLDRNEKRHSESSAAELQLALRRWQGLESKVRNINSARKRAHFHLRIYDGVPSLFLMIADNTMLFAPYVYSGRRGSPPCIQVKAQSGPIYESYRDHFELLWQSSRDTSDHFPPKTP